MSVRVLPLRRPEWQSVVHDNRRMFARLSAFVIWSLVAAGGGVLGAALWRRAAAGAGLCGRRSATSVAVARRPGPAVRRAAASSPWPRRRDPEAPSRFRLLGVMAPRSSAAQAEPARRPGADRGRRQAGASLTPSAAQPRQRPGAAVRGPAHRVARPGAGRAQRPARVAGAAAAATGRAAAAAGAPVSAGRMRRRPVPTRALPPSEPAVASGHRSRRWQPVPAPAMAPRRPRRCRRSRAAAGLGESAAGERPTLPSPDSFRSQ